MSFFAKDEIIEFLTQQNKRLEQRIVNLEELNLELSRSLFTKTPTAPSKEALAEKPPVKHVISKDENETTANCSCGWFFRSDDPGELQQQISSHYRASVVSRGRKSWPQVKALVETAATSKPPGEV